MIYPLICMHEFNLLATAFATHSLSTHSRSHSLARTQFTSQWLFGPTRSTQTLLRLLPTSTPQYPTPSLTHSPCRPRKAPRRRRPLPRKPLLRRALPRRATLLRKTSALLQLLLPLPHPLPHSPLPLSLPLQ